jgi:hypothetical protein
VRHDADDGEFIAFDLEVESPAPIDATLSKFVGAFQLFRAQRRVSWIYQ